VTARVYAILDSITVVGISSTTFFFNSSNSFLIDLLVSAGFGRVTHYPNHIHQSSSSNLSRPARSCDSRLDTRSSTKFHDRSAALYKMADEKTRSSGEVQRSEPVLPTVNPAVEKPEPPKAALHPAFYVAYVLRPHPNCGACTNG
jgi:hypothetical protein